MTTANERSAIGACRRGEIEGLGVLYEIYKERVFRTCHRILGDAALAEDVAQEVFLRVFEQIRRFDERSRFSTWLYRLAVNRALNAAQKARREGRPAPAPPPGPAPGDPEVLRGLLAGLSLEQRAVLVLREIEGLSYAEIADALAIPVGTVMSRLARARAELSLRWPGMSE